MYVHVLLTLVGGVSSDVSRSSCTTSFTPCHPIFCWPLLLCFLPSMPVFLYLVKCTLETCILGRRFFFPRHHSENAVLTRLHLLFLHACPNKKGNESHFSINILGKEFASCLKFIQYALLSFSPSNLSTAYHYPSLIITRMLGRSRRLTPMLKLQKNGSRLTPSTASIWLSRISWIRAWQCGKASIGQFYILCQRLL